MQRDEIHPFLGEQRRVKREEENEQIPKFHSMHRKIFDWNRLRTVRWVTFTDAKKMNKMIAVYF